MHNLKQYMRFDFDAFSEGKEYTVTYVSEWKDYNTKENLGTKVVVAITKDETEYHSKNGNVKTNLMERLIFKVTKKVEVSANSKVYPVNPRATAYGIDHNGNFSDYLNRLSVTCDDVTIV